MPDKYIIEMVCDWNAKIIEENVSSNNNANHQNTMDFYLNTALDKYKFTNAQQKLIVCAINKLQEINSDLMKIWQR